MSRASGNTGPAQAPQETPVLQVGSPEREDLERAAWMASKALGASPPYVYAYGEGRDTKVREQALEFLFLRSFQLALPGGCCRGAYELPRAESGAEGAPRERQLVCFFMFVPQGQQPQPSFCDFVRSGLLGGMLRYGFGTMLRLARVTMWAEEVEKELLGDRPVIRLEGMVVDPSRQGLGVGTQALAPSLEEADQQGLEVFLATQEERSLAFYRRLGFSVLKEATHPAGGFITWFMLRPVGGVAP